MGVVWLQKCCKWANSVSFDNMDSKRLHRIFIVLTLSCLLTVYYFCILDRDIKTSFAVKLLVQVSIFIPKSRDLYVRIFIFSGHFCLKNCHFTKVMVELYLWCFGIFVEYIDIWHSWPYSAGCLFFPPIYSM